MAIVDPAQLARSLADRQPGPVHVFWGEDVTRLEHMVDAVENLVDPADRPFAVERLYAAEPGGLPIDIAAAARVYPMLGDRRIVIVLRAERLLKPKRASKAAEAAQDEAEGEGAGEDEAAAADLAPLEEYLKNPSPSTLLLFVASEVDRGRRFTKALFDKALVTEFAGLADRSARPSEMHAAAKARAIAHITQAFADARRPIDRDAALLLAERAAGDIARLRGEVERLMLFTEGQSRVSARDAGAIVSEDVAVTDDWAVTNAIGDGRADVALRELALRFDRGDSPHAIVGQLRWWVSARLAHGDASRVRAAVDALLRTDLALKRSAGDDRVLVERLVVELTGKPLPQRGWR